MTTQSIIPIGITIPKLVEISLSNPTEKPLDRFQEFFVKAQTCLADINNLSQKAVDQKRQCYKDLRGSIKEALKSKPEVKKESPSKDAESSSEVKEDPMLAIIFKLTELSKQVKIAKNKLNNAYETSSILLMMTLNQTHFKQVKPGETVLSPETEASLLKVNPDDLAQTFININKLERPEFKLTALLELRSVIESKIDELEKKKAAELSVEEESVLKGQIADYSKKLVTVEEFAKTCVSFKELFESITELKDKNLSDLVDITGRNHALYLLRPSVSFSKPGIPIDQKAIFLIKLLTMLVEDRYSKNPTRPILGYFRDWPRSKEVLEKYPEYNDKVFQRKAVAAILSVQGKHSKEKKGNTGVRVCEYLLNLFDPAGAIRVEFYKSKGLPLVKLCAQFARTRHCLAKFGYATNQLDPLVIQSGSKKAPHITAKNFAQSITSGDFKDIENVAMLLKNYEVKVYKSVTPINFLDTFDASCTNIGIQFAQNKLISWLYSLLKSAKNEKEQINLYKAVLKLAFSLVKQGEFSISFILLMDFLDQNDHKKLYTAAWESIKGAKEFKFLEEVFDPGSNNKNLKIFAAEKLKKIACLPFFGIAPKAIVMMKQGLELLLGKLKDQLKDLLKDKMDAFYILLGKKYLEIASSSKVKSHDKTEEKKELKDAELLALGKSHLFDNFEYLLDTLKKFNSDLYEASRAGLLKTITEAVEQQQMLLDFSGDILIDLWTADYVHSGEFWQLLDKQSDLIKVINK